MNVIDSEYYAWFLFEHEGHLYLDANCNHGAFGYSFMIQLNNEELSEYESTGRDYISKLAHAIHYSAPIVKDNTSVYKDRIVDDNISKLSLEAIQRWRSR